MTLCQIKSIRMLRGPILCLAHPRCGGQSKGRAEMTQTSPRVHWTFLLKAPSVSGGARAGSPQIPALLTGLLMNSDPQAWVSKHPYLVRGI